MSTPKISTPRMSTPRMSTLKMSTPKKTRCTVHIHVFCAQYQAHFTVFGTWNGVVQDLAILMISRSILTHENNHSYHFGTYQARSQDYQKGGYLRNVIAREARACVHKHARLGGSGGMPLREIFKF